MSTAFSPGIEGTFRGVPAETYHAAPGISQSTLKAFGQAGSPLHFRVLAKKEQTEDMAFGTLVHAAVLEPETFSGLYYVRPGTYPSKDGEKKWTKAAKFCSEWHDQHSDRIIITELDLEMIQIIRKNITDHPLIGGALKIGEREVSHFKMDEETGMLLKARTDILAIDSNTNLTIILDLKKVQSGAGCREDFTKSVWDYGYYLQAASYLSIVGASRFIFCVFDDGEPGDIALHELKPDFLALGHLEWRYQLQRYAKCHKENKWPGYGSHIHDLAMPYWGKKREEDIREEQHKLWLEKVAASQIIQPENR